MDNWAYITNDYNSELMDRLQVADLDGVEAIDWLRENIRDLRVMGEDGSLGGELLEVLIEITQELITEIEDDMLDEITGVDEIEKIEKLNI